MFRVPLLRPLPRMCACAIVVPAVLCSAVISGTVKDPSGSLVPQAVIQVSGSALPQAVVVSSNAQGHFATPDLPPGSYTVRASAQGFDVLSRNVELSDAPLAIDLQLAVATAVQEVTVVGKARQFANNDPVYRQLRTVGLGATITVENFTLKNDVGEFLLKQGTLTFLAPVNNEVTGAVFLGQGHFHMPSPLPITTLRVGEPVRLRPLLG